ncbi:MAG: DUF2271 domain-containing protein [Bacteroidales bacterium]|nr:DUF2271 domain-containing protein [Bacteroidales bacterium]
MKIWIFTLVFASLFGVIKAQTSGTLTVSATTSKTTTPTYSPKNIVAIWIVDSNGKFVKTLLALADERKQYLVNWKTVTTVAGSAYNKLDAVTGATQNSHATRTCSWNGKDKSSALVADGTYTLKMELTDNDGVKQNLASFTFTKGTAEQTLTPATTSGFSNISIKWTPVNTAIDEVKLSDQYNIYPNPTHSTVYVNGFDIEEIELFTLNGKSILTTNNQNLDLSSLPKGIYLAKLTTKTGIFMKKIEKN